MTPTQSNHKRKVGAFRFERELQKEIATIDLKLLNLSEEHSITFSRREVPVGACIPDLIYVQFMDIPDPHMWPRQWTFRHSYVIWLLRRDSDLTLDALAASFYESPSGKIKQTLRDLVLSGAILEDVPQHYVLSPDMRAVKAEVIAVEAKLSRWTKALEQAQDYMNFADKVFVAMDANLLPRREKVLDKFRDLGIGLCAILPRQTEWLVYPRSNQNETGSDHEYLVSSAASFSRQTSWSIR